MAKESIVVGGMSCQHCVQSVTKALSALPGVVNVRVDLPSGRAEYEAQAPVDKDAVRKAVEDAGFEVKG